ncbi:hypothetical protein CH252_18705 [Rhodococcus sp. 06-1477-1B]|nr:hypothetical protein CH252_18705 [Rhodococcus sp. 06-1477-1B]
MPTFPRLANGRVSFPGRASHVKEYDFGWGGSVPAGFTTQGTVAVEGGNGGGALRVTIASSIAGFTLPDGIDLSDGNVKAIIWTAQGLRYPGSGWPSELFFSIEGAGTIGGGWRRSPVWLYDRVASPTTVSARVTTTFLNKPSSSTLSVVMLPRTKQIALLSGDQCVNMGDFPNLDVSGVAYPKMIFQGSAGNTAAISKLRLEVRTD